MSGIRRLVVLGAGGGLAVALSAGVLAQSPTQPPAEVPHPVFPATVRPAAIGPVAPQMLPSGEGGGGGGGGGTDTPSSGGDFSLDWLTIDGGGIMYATGATPGGDFSLGSSAGQPDPGVMSGECFQWVGGFWVVVASPNACYANCDGSNTAPILNVADFTCFLQKFAAGDCYANCDQSVTPPVLNVADFTCFLQSFAAGCP